MTHISFLSRHRRPLALLFLAVFAYTFIGSAIAVEDTAANTSSTLAGDKNLLETCFQDEVDAVWSNSGVANCCDQSRLSTEAIHACKNEATKLSTKVLRYTTRQCPGSQTAFHQHIEVVACDKEKSKLGKRSCTATGKAKCCMTFCVGNSELGVENATS